MNQYSPQYVMVPVAERNTLGLVGFIISLVGLVLTGGILCPIGLILSLVAIGRQPRGFAIAGVILGFLGTCGGVLAVLVFGAVILAALGIGAAAMFVAMAEPERMEITIDMAQIAERIEQERHRGDYLPASLTALNLPSETLVDPWGNNYEYTLTEEKPGYDIISYGPDGQIASLDDIHLTKLDEYWENYFKVTEDKSGGTVQFRMGDRTMTVHGHEQGGRVTVNTGDRSIEIVGGQGGGQVIVTPSAPDAPDGPIDPEAPEAPAPAPAREPPAEPVAPAPG
jgi:hypothetical protein